MLAEGKIIQLRSICSHMLETIERYSDEEADVYLYRYRFAQVIAEN